MSQSEPVKNLSEDTLTEQAVVLSIEQFCRRNLISYTTFFAMRDRGEGPREIRIGARVLISMEAERDWHRARERPEAHDQGMIERLRQRGHTAAAASKAKRAAYAEANRYSKPRKRTRRRP